MRSRAACACGAQSIRIAAATAASTRNVARVGEQRERRTARRGEQTAHGGAEDEARVARELDLPVGAARSCCSPATSGSSANSAGIATALRQPIRATSTSISASPSANASPPDSAAAASELRISSRRGDQVSARSPAGPASSAAGLHMATNSAATATPVPPRSSTRSASGTSATRSPSDESPTAATRRRRSRALGIPTQDVARDRDIPVSPPRPRKLGQDRRRYTQRSAAGQAIR